MNIREAILKAADHIERNPGEFKFSGITIPNHPGCGTPGCALGWIGTFANAVEIATTHVDDMEYGRGVITVRSISCVASSDLSPITDWSMLGITAGEFYRRMDAFGAFWRVFAPDCARALRLYADKFHPAKPVVTPNWSAIASAHPIPDDVRSQELSRV